MTILHLIHGFVGVGKTTFSKKLEHDTKAVRFTFDEWMIALFGQNPSKEVFEEFESKIKALIWDTAKKNLQIGNDIILDFGFWKRTDRDHYKAMAKEIGVNVKLYNLQCSEDVLIKRVLQRTAKMQCGDLFIDKNAINEFKGDYESVAPEEGGIFVQTDY